MGGARTTASLMDAGLVDELRLITYPLVAGDGAALFATTKRRRSLELQERPATRRRARELDLRRRLTGVPDPMGLAGAVAFAGRTRRSVLTTIRRDGRPQLSNVFHQVCDDGLIRISITADRAKYRNLSRARGRRCTSPGPSSPGWSWRATSTCRRSPPAPTTPPSTSWSPTTGPPSATTRTGVPFARPRSPTGAPWPASAPPTATANPPRPDTAPSRHRTCRDSGRGHRPTVAGLGAVGSPGTAPGRLPWLARAFGGRKDGRHPSS